MDGFPRAERLVDECSNLIRVELRARRAVDLHRIVETRTRPMKRTPLGDALTLVARTRMLRGLPELAAHRAAVRACARRPAQSRERAQGFDAQVRPASP